MPTSLRSILFYTTVWRANVLKYDIVTIWFGRFGNIEDIIIVLLVYSHFTFSLSNRIILFSWEIGLSRNLYAVYNCTWD